MLRIPNLGESVWFDELWATRVHLDTPGTAFWTVISDIHPPFYAFLMFLWIRVFGDSEISIRIIPLLAGLATVAVAQVGLRPALGRAAAAWTGLFLALSPAHIWYSQEARSYSLLMLLVMLSYVLWQRSPRLSGPARRIGYLLTVVAATLTHYYAVAYSLAQSALAIARPRAERRRIWLANATALGLVAAFIGLRIAMTGGMVTQSAYLRTFSLFEFWMVIATWAPTGYAIWPTPMGSAGFGGLPGNPAMLATQLLVLGLTIAGVHSLLRDPSPRRGGALDYLGMCLCLPLLLAALAIWGGGDNYIERSFLPALPFFFGLWGRGIASVKLPSLRRLAGAASVALLGVGLGHYFYKPDQLTVYKPNPDWRALAAYLNSRAPPPGKESILLITSPADELIYYGAADLEPGLKPWRIVPSKPLSTPELCTLASGEDAGGRYVVRNLYWIDGAGRLVEKLRRDCGVAGIREAEFKGLRLLRLSGGGGER